MKKMVYALVCFLLMTSLYSCYGGYYVSSPPPPVAVVRPIAPGPGFVWIGGDYYWSGGRYQYRNGYWARPHYGRTYVSGGWEHGSRGYYWRRGAWR